MAPGSDAETPTRLPVVHVLISEDFFLERVAGVLRALRKDPVTPPWGEDLFERLASTDSLGLVVDLELAEAEALPLLKRFLADPRTRERTVVSYCSLEARGLQAAAISLGLKVVPRSTLAANLVKILQAFGPPEAPRD